MAGSFIDNCIYCNSCVNKLFNHKRVILKSKGNIMADTVFLIPNKTYGEELHKVLYDLYLDITGKDIYEECYVTYNIKCPYCYVYNFANKAAEQCYKILDKELTKVPYKRIFVFGEAWKSLFVSKPVSARYDISGKQIYVLPSLGLYYKDMDKFNKLKELLNMYLNG